MSLATLWPSDRRGHGRSPRAARATAASASSSPSISAGTSIPSGKRRARSASSSRWTSQMCLEPHGRGRRVAVEQGRDMGQKPACRVRASVAAARSRRLRARREAASTCREPRAIPPPGRARPRARSGGRPAGRRATGRLLDGREASRVGELRVDVIEEGPISARAVRTASRSGSASPHVGREQLGLILEPGLRGAVASHAPREVGRPFAAGSERHGLRRRDRVDLAIDRRQPLADLQDLGSRSDGPRRAGSRDGFPRPPTGSRGSPSRSAACRRARSTGSRS